VQGYNSSFAVCAFVVATQGPSGDAIWLLHCKEQGSVVLLSQPHVRPLLVPPHLHLQAAKTYLEKHYESFPTASLDTLIRHGLKALAGSLSDGELTSQVGQGAGLMACIPFLGMGGWYGTLGNVSQLLLPANQRHRPPTPYLTHTVCLSGHAELLLLHAPFPACARRTQQLQ
jgi:hypothetical protein